ncbi:hypothetical protein CROQUDRAFT_10143, partial [Cronartium quercuum f. sp. fusiforme G11]
IVYTLDESAIVQRELYCDYGRAFKGHRTKRQRQMREGVQYSLLPEINLDGLLAVACQEGSYLCEDFEDYLEFNLVCSSFEMNPYPLPSSVLIIDNAQIHHGGRIDELCEEQGI